MQVLTIVWTLMCAAVIIGYPVFLYKKSASLIETSKERTSLFSSNTVELLSFDISNYFPGWSFSLNVPEITEEVLFNSPVLFYLESDETCMKLPLNNATLGYTATAYKNIGKIYVTFKSLKDGVSNFYIPSYHLRKLKVLIIKSQDQRIYGDWSAKPNRSEIYKSLQKAGININDYEDVLGYFSNIANIDFKGHFKINKPNPVKNYNKQPKVVTTENRDLTPMVS